MAQIQSGFLLMIIGMGTVFSFLAIMVGAILVSSRVSARFAHLLPEPEPKSKSRKPAAKEDPSSLLTVIAAAIHRYRQEHE